MATDYAEKERVFIASLEADTGQPLAAWTDEPQSPSRRGR